MQITHKYRDNQSHTVKRKVVRLTDYYKRFKMLKSGLPRLVIRKTGRYVIAQMAEYDPIGDHILWTKTTKSLVAQTPELCGTSARACVLLGQSLPLNETSDFIIDIGMRRPVEGKNFFVGFVCDGIRPNVSESQAVRLWKNTRV